MMGKRTGINMRSKGSAPRAADAVRYARARNIAKCEMGKKKIPMIGANSDLIMPRGTRAELFVLCYCAVRLLAMPLSHRQYGCNLRNKKHDREDNQMLSITDEYTRTYRYLVPGVFMIPGTAVSSKESTAHRGTATHRTAPHGTA